MPTYDQTQGDNYSGIVEIASIDFNDVNALAAGQFETVQIVAAIPANVQVIGLYSKTITAFASVTRDIETISNGLDTARPPVYPVSTWQLASVETTTLDSTRFLPPDGYSQFNTVAQDIYIGLDWLAQNNPQDYTAGEIKFYIEYKSFPTLN